MRIILFHIVLLTLIFGQSCGGKSGGRNGCTPTSTPETKLVKGYLRNHKQERVIVFVHGVLGDAKDTWTACNGAYFPALLLEDDVFAGFDVFVYDYPSPYFATSYSISELADDLRLSIEESEIFDKHREIFFVAHSMGGLVVRQFLLKYPRLALKVPMIYFFATPTTGSELTELAKAAGSFNAQFENMKVWKNTEYVGDLVGAWHAAKFNNIESYCAYELRTTYGFKIVSKESATHSCNNRFDPIDADHMEIVKPTNNLAKPYIALKQAVLRTLPTPTPPPPPPPRTPSPSPTPIPGKPPCTNREKFLGLRGC